MTAELDEHAMKPIGYFSHDANAAQDIKCKRLIRRLGVEGYGRWWLLCETLAQVDGHMLRCATDDDWEIVADYLLFDSTEDARQFVDTLRDLGLVAADASHIWSKRMHENARKVSARRKGAMITNAKRWGGAS